MIELDESFAVAGTPADVMRLLADVERVAPCVPGVSLEGRDAEGNFLGVMTVAFGPKRIRFQGKVTCSFDEAARTGLLVGGGAAANARAAGVRTHTTFAVNEAPNSTPAAPVSVVAIHATAELQGVLADFGRTGGAALGRELMREFARNLGALIGASTAASAAPPPASVPAEHEAAAPAPVPPAAAGGTDTSTRPAAPPARPVSASRLLWLMLVGFFRRLFRAGK